MSDLWDYDDDDDQGNGGGWEVPAQDDDDVIVEVEEADTNKKRKGGRKPAKSSKANKRRAVSPPIDLELKPIPRPETSLLDDDDDEDDLVLLPSPVAATVRGGADGAAADGNPRGAGAAPFLKPAVATLNPATQQSLAKEQELLRALQQVTEREHHLDDEPDPTPLPSVSRLAHLGFSRFHTGRLPAPAFGGGAAGAGAPGDASDDDDVVLAVDVPAPGGAGTRGGLGASDVTGTDVDGATAAATAAAAAAPAADRVQLKLVWGRDKDECLKMRVVKTDPFSKLVEKFREIARQRSLCRDPSKIKFLFDGDDLAKTPAQTPESLDMEDDMMIDVKLPL